MKNFLIIYVKYRKYKRAVIYFLLLSIFFISLYMLIHIFYWLRVHTFILSHEVIINSRYALELSVVKKERIIYSFEYSPKLNTILFYQIYGEQTKKAYVPPQLLPSGIKALSPTNTYIFYFENGSIYPEGEIVFSTYFYQKRIRFFKNGKVIFIDE